MKYPYSRVSGSEVSLLVVLEIHHQTVALLIGQHVQELVADPELGPQVPEPLLVALPRLVEVHLHTKSEN